jgi:hypothetical protein
LMFKGVEIVVYINGSTTINDIQNWTKGSR